MAIEAVEKLLYRVPEVVEATGYSRSLVYVAISAGELKVVRKGRTVRITAEDLKAWIANQG